MTRAEKQHLSRVAELPCSVCYAMGMVNQGDHAPVVVHHIRTGAGAGQRAGAGLTIPLCYDHHAGDMGIHAIGTRVWEMRFGTELTHLNSTILLLESLG